MSRNVQSGRRGHRWALLAVLGTVACSSVDTVNERALQLAADTPPATTAIDPAELVRPDRSEYVIGPRDLLEIEVYELEEPNRSKLLKVRVSQDGAVLLPLIGQITAGGRTAAAVQNEVVERLAADYLVNPSVTLVVAEHRSRRVTVLGAVKAPGSFALHDNSTTLVDALALAGGAAEAAGSTVYVMRADGLPSDVAVADAASGKVVTGTERPRLVKVDLSGLVERGDLSQNCVLQDGDVVHVPPASHFFVMGHVEKGGSFPLRGEITLLRAIAMAGGLKTTATPSSTVLIRTTPKGRVSTPIDLDEVEAGSEQDLRLQPDDVIVVNESGEARVARSFTTFVKGLFTLAFRL